MPPKNSCIVSASGVHYSTGDTMSKSEKLLERFLSKPKDFTFAELETLLFGFGFTRSASATASGSAVRFINHKTKHIIRLHKPHPSPELKQYAIKYMIAELTQGGYLNDR